MDPTADGSFNAVNACSSIEAIRRSVNMAQCECVCTFHLCFCMLTDTAERAGIQPFLYEQGVPA